MIPVGFEHEITASEQPQNHSLDCATTAIGQIPILHCVSSSSFVIGIQMHAVNYWVRNRNWFVMVNFRERLDGIGI